MPPNKRRAHPRAACPSVDCSSFQQNSADSIAANIDGQDRGTAPVPFPDALGKRIANVLRACNINTPAELLAYGRSAVAREQRMGTVSVAKLDDWIASSHPQTIEQWRWS